MIKLTETEFLDFDASNFIIVKKKVNNKEIIVRGEDKKPLKDSQGKNVKERSENYGQEYFENETFYGSLSQLESRLIESKLKKADQETLIDMFKNHRNLIASITPVDSIVKQLRDTICNLEGEVIRLTNILDKKQKGE